MEIIWYGLSCFRLIERGSPSVITDPYPDKYGYVFPRPRADIITISHDDPTRNAAKAPRGPSQLLTGPGEYEIGGVFVTGVALVGSKPRKSPPIRNIVYLFEYNGLTICHVGELNHVPSQSQIERLGTVNVLLTPAGGKNLISAAQAAELISMLEPNLVIPMHYLAPPCKLKLPRISTFLKEMGTNSVKPVESLKVTPSNLPQETQVVLLTPRQ
jgi:L-ascorbate metabolism protein UlaG (beta-lactamase superfamily)